MMRFITKGALSLQLGGEVPGPREKDGHGWS
jgi:hypothetical protein